MKPFDQLLLKKPGEYLTADEVNAIITRLKVHRERATGHEGPDHDVTRPQDKAVAEWVQVYAAEEVAAYSVFGVTPGESFDEPPKAQIKRVGLNYPGSPMCLLTNDSIPIPAGCYGYARPISLAETARLRVTGTTPSVGWPCGVEPDTYGITGAPSTYGFVCVGVGYGGAVDVVRTREPVAVVGTVTEKVTRFNKKEKKLGTGVVGAMYCDYGDQNKLKDAPDPANTKPWSFPVFNICTEEYAVGKVVKAESVLGIGLVLQPPCPQSSFSDSSDSSDSGEGPTLDVLVCPPVIAAPHKLRFPQKRVHFPPGTWFEDVDPTDIWVCCLGSSDSGSSSQPPPSSSEPPSESESIETWYVWHDGPPPSYWMVSREAGVIGDEYWVKGDGGDMTPEVTGSYAAGGAASGVATISDGPDFGLYVSGTLDPDAVGYYTYLGINPTSGLGVWRRTAPAGTAPDMMRIELVGGLGSPLGRLAGIYVFDLDSLCAVDVPPQAVAAMSRVFLHPSPPRASGLATSFEIRDLYMRGGTWEMTIVFNAGAERQHELRFRAPAEDEALPRGRRWEQAGSSPAGLDIGSIELWT